MTTASNTRKMIRTRRALLIGSSCRRRGRVRRPGVLLHGRGLGREQPEPVRGDGPGLAEQGPGAPFLLAGEAAEDLLLPVLGPAPEELLELGLGQDVAGPQRPQHG